MNFAQEIKNMLDTREVFAFYGFKLNNSGKILCPFHNEKTPSFQVYKGSRGFYCFGCHEGGDIIYFVQKYFNLSFQDSLKKLNYDFRLNLPIGEKITLRDKYNFLKTQKKHILEQKEQEKNKNIYWQAFENWKMYNDLLEIYKPKRGEKPNLIYLEALKNIKQAEFELEEAGYNL